MNQDKNNEIERIKSIILDNKTYIEKEYNISNIGIFGSYVRGENNIDSDIDILVEFSKPIGFFKFIQLENYLQEILGKKVDLVTKQALKPVIGKYILSEVVMV